MDACHLQSFRRGAGNMLNLPQWFNGKGQALDPYSDHGRMRHLSQNRGVETRDHEPYGHCSGDMCHLPQRQHGGWQTWHAHPDKRVLRYVSQDVVVEYSHNESQRHCTGNLLDLPQWFNRNG